MANGHSCGPEAEPAFFDEVKAVFEKHPDVSSNYSISCLDHYTDLMRIDFNKTVKIATIEGERVTVRFNEMESEANASRFCCEWAPRMGGGWICLQRWS